MSGNSGGPESLIGQSVAGYRLERLLGIGLTGAVFLGRREGDAPAAVEGTESLPVERPLEAAIKVLILPWQLTPDERADFRTRFDREAETLKRLRHPNIVSLLDSGTDEQSGYTYMVLPYLAGGTLADYFASHQGLIPLGTVSTILTQIAGALAEAHAQGIVHRDIKPANILLDEQHRLYLTDFSIARLLAETAPKLTTTGRVMGTGAYMPPEQVKGEAVGPAADIYSLGMVVYELVTGKPAFNAPSIASLLHQQVQEQPAAPRLTRPDLPEPAQAAILRALAKNPAERFASPKAFATAFAEGLENRVSADMASYTPSVPQLLPSVPQPLPNTPQSLPDAMAITQPAPPVRWDVPSPVPQPISRSALTTVVVGVVALLLVSCFALAAVSRGGLGGMFGGPSTPSVAQLGAGGTTSPTTGQATATSPTSHTPGARQPTDTPRPGAPPPPGTTATPTFTPSPTPTFTPSPTPTFTPRPPTPTFTPLPPPPKTIQIGWSSAHPTWIWMTFNHFPPGTYTYSCNFSTPPQSNSFTIYEATEPETWDNGKTCYDQQAGDHVWVIVNGVWSNTLTVP